MARIRLIGPTSKDVISVEWDSVPRVGEYVEVRPKAKREDIGMVYRVQWTASGSVIVLLLPLHDAEDPIDG